MSDDELLARAEEALTEIKVVQGLSERHEAVLAAIRIRLKGSADASLEDLLAAASDDEPSGAGLDRAIEGSAEGPSTSLDDLLAEEPTKPEWPAG
jgi:hypothetical protein